MVLATVIAGLFIINEIQLTRCFDKPRAFILLDIGENGRLNPAFSAAFFAFDDKLFEFEDAASSG